jgi:hypothetical protein
MARAARSTLIPGLHGGIADRKERPRAARSAHTAVNAAGRYGAISGTDGCAATAVFLWASFRCVSPADTRSSHQPSHLAAGTVEGRIVVDVT